ncbi:hypothetical protein M569_06965 [Genlisea aurea]|uniref:Uncharacterized protein n=1 Tax=Genlisea aurea TaxID=192259 RepID=S8CM39_9LAMI|nr:hypothetical protein M569_06965 [Genlisea aurea]
MTAKTSGHLPGIRRLSESVPRGDRYSTVEYTVDRDSDLGDVILLVSLSCRTGISF